MIVAIAAIFPLVANYSLSFNVSSQRVCVEKFFEGALRQSFGDLQTIKTLTIFECGQF